ncbi:MAG: hypothetical protein HZB16_15080 [Armatimonadetes bacterium]|nr:hypothetical protein [Armatimonadota bacterium]
MPRWCLLLLVTSTIGAALPGVGSATAWVRCQQSAQVYAERNYWWLGEVTLQVHCDAPERIVAVALLWGAKQDDRAARLAIGRDQQVVRHGGYDGYEWVIMPIGPTTAPLLCTLSAPTEGKPAFIAEVRFLSDSSADGDLAAPRHLASVTTAAAVVPPRPDAFPAMRPRWDRVPVYPEGQPGGAESAFRAAERHSRLASEGLYRCRRYVDGWLAQADPVSGLIPRNLGDSRDLWNGRDSAADNYPFMVLTCALTDRALLDGRMRAILATERALTRRLDRLGDQWRFSTQSFWYPQPDPERMVFDNAEYVKDGLIPLTEWLGPSPWSDRMVELVEDIWKNAAVATRFGTIPTQTLEVNGDLMQSCARLYWFTGQGKFLDWGIRLGDYYLLGDHHPSRDLAQLRFADHDCEVINGLSELYLACAYARPAKREQWRAPLHELYRCMLAVGRNPDGLLWTSIDPRAGTHAASLCDTWGYNYDGLLTAGLVDGVPEYRAAVRHVLSNLGPRYHGRPWADTSQDGIADSVEGALNLYNRERLPNVPAYLDHQTREMWNAQQPDGTIERWHGDGNFARTTIMVTLWRTQGLHLEPWRDDVRVGAVLDGDTLRVSLSADAPWSGRLLFDRPRHSENLHLPVDYPRINQFPEWFTAQRDARYQLDWWDGSGGTRTGSELVDGLPVTLTAGGERRLSVWRRQTPNG